MAEINEIRQSVESIMKMVPESRVRPEASLYNLLENIPLEKVSTKVNPTDAQEDSVQITDDDAGEFDFFGQPVETGFFEKELKK